MNCKFCDASLEEGVAVCPSCGKAQAEEAEETLAPVCDESAEVTEEAEAEDCRCEASEEAEAPEAPAEEEPASEPQPAKPKLTRGRIALIAVCGVLLLGILVAAILMGAGIELGPQGEGILYKSSYTVDDAKAVRAHDKVVVRFAGRELTNGELQAHYFGNLYQFMDTYGTSYFDFSAPLDGQILTQAEMTWQQYFLDMSITNWHNYIILDKLAEEAGFEADQSDVEVLRADLEAAALEYGFESADAMIQNDMGSGCSLEDYLAYISLVRSGNQYVEHLNATMEVTLEEMESYYAKNEQAFIDAGLDKSSGNMVDVRHILIMPEANADTNEVSEAQKKAALEEAEKLLAQWKAGAATEESFAALATEHTDDGGSKGNGGLYTEITPYSSYVEPFLTWSVDPSRQPGDTGIVETEFGYHIMYWVSGEEEWISAATTQLLAERLTEVTDAAKEQYPIEINYRKIAMADLGLK